MNKIISELNFNFIPSIKKRVEDDTKDFICHSCFKKELDGEILKDTALMWGNGVIDPSSQLESMCNDCFKLELDEPNFSRHLLSPYLYCTQCGLDLEKDNKLFSAIRGICNHCYLKEAQK